MEMERNVKDLLEELKNLSQLMLDLGYSAVFFKSKQIAKEVFLLYERLEELEEELYLHLFAATRGKMIRKFISVIELVESAKTVANAARNLAELVLEGKQLHPIVKAALKHSDESIVRTKVSKRSILANKTLGELKLRSNVGVDIIAIRRNGRWIFDPKKHTKILPGDMLIGVGTIFSCKKLERIAKGELREL